LQNNILIKLQLLRCFHWLIFNQPPFAAIVRGFFIFMNKSYYFSHDYTASEDVKILYLRQELGMEGYGIYWFIVERLAVAGGRLPLKIIPVLAMQMQSTETKVKAVIQSFELFTLEETNFFSQRLLQTIELRETLQQNGKLGAAKRWAKNNDNSKNMVL